MNTIRGKLPKDICLIVDFYLYNDHLLKLNKEYSQKFKRYWNEERMVFYDNIINTYIAMYRSFVYCETSKNYWITGTPMKDHDVVAVEEYIYNFKNFVNDKSESVYKTAELPLLY